jgi:hypothetical protein
MAVIDARLLPLIETLAGAGADWLAFELFDGIHLGRTPEDSDEETHRARLAVREFRKEEHLPEEPDLRTTAATPIVGDEQIDWAAAYVVDRISDSIGMLEASLNNLESIASKGGDSRLISDGESLQSQGVVAIRMERDEIVIRRTQIDKGIANLSALKAALSSWAESVKAGGHAS